MQPTYTAQVITSSHHLQRSSFSSNATKSKYTQIKHIHHVNLSRYQQRLAGTKFLNCHMHENDGTASKNEGVRLPYNTDHTLVTASAYALLELRCKMVA